jgi:DNA polymerase III sliding clamp (beta) subunit (PCNA family)
MSTDIQMVPTDVLRCIIAAFNVADKDRTSAVLASVYVRVSNGLATIAATDGKSLCEHRLSVEQSLPECRLLLAPTSLRLLRAVLSREPMTRVQLASDSMAVYLAKRSRAPVPLETIENAKYPEYENALPKDGSHVELGLIGLDLKRLATLEKAMFIAGWAHPRNIRVSFHGQGKGVILRPLWSGSAHTVTGLLMPITLPG